MLCALVFKRHSVAGSSMFRNHTFIAQLSGVLCMLHECVCVCVCGVCVCVCVCVCTDSFQLKLGSQIDFSVFSAPLFGIFDVSQRPCSQNQCLFPLPLLVPLELGLKRICCHCHFQHVFFVSGSVFRHLVIRLLFGCLDSEPNNNNNN